MKAIVAYLKKNGKECVKSLAEALVWSVACFVITDVLSLIPRMPMLPEWLIWATKIVAVATFVFSMGAQLISAVVGVLLERELLLAERDKQRAEELRKRAFDAAQRRRDSWQRAEKGLLSEELRDVALLQVTKTRLERGEPAKDHPF